MLRCPVRTVVLIARVLCVRGRPDYEYFADSWREGRSYLVPSTTTNTSEASALWDTVRGAVHFTSLDQ